MASKISQHPRFRGIFTMAASRLRKGPQPGKGAPWLTSCLPFKILPAIINP